MKICLLNDAFPPVIDGVANTLVNYARILSEKNSVLVGTTEYPGEDYSKWPFRVTAFPSADTEQLTGGYRTGYPFAIKELAEMAAFEPDLIHAHGPMASMFIGRSLREACGAPLVMTYHTKYDIDIRRCIRSRFLQEESIRALVHSISAADEVWAVSEGAGENLKSLGYEGEYKVVVNGVDFPKGRAGDDEVAAAVKDYDLPSGVPVFLFVGRLMNYKGLPLLIKALSILKETEDFRMVFIGKGADEESLKNLCAEFGLCRDEKTENGTVVSFAGSGKGKVIFTGPVSDRNVLRAWNTRADLFVFPSTFDTNGLVVREAAACGLASVLIRGSCAAEGVTDGRNGYLCEENEESLGEVLRFACTHPDEIHEVGEKAMDEIYLSWQDAVANAYRLYCDLIERKKSGRLAGRKPLGDDPLYEMAAEAAIRNMTVTQKDIPEYEGMLENLETVRDQISDGFAKQLRQLEDMLFGDK